MSDDQDRIRKEILSALAHQEAEDGLYLNNLQVVHEEEDRTLVSGSQLEILEALKVLIEEGAVDTDESGDDVIFSLTNKAA